MSRSTPPPGEGRGEGWVVAQMALLAGIALAPRRAPGLPAWPEPLRAQALALGLALGAGGGLLAALGARDLGPSLTPFPKPGPNTTLVRGGVYGVVRHPIYAGLLLAALGWSLVRGSLPALALSAALGVFFDRKASLEERWLAQRFAGYAEYRRATRKLIPWLY